MDDTAVDVRLRSALTREAEATIDVDVDAAWAELVRRLEPTPRRRPGTRWMAAAAVVLVALAVGRPAIVELRGQVANFGRFVEEVVVPARPGQDRPPDPAHDPIPESDTYRRELRRVHDRLNGVVFGGDSLERLGDADGRLEDLLGQRPELDDDLRRAIAQIESAIEEDDRGSAAEAHGTIEDLERKAAAR
jgi:hypothetical protein